MKELTSLISYCNHNYHGLVCADNCINDNRCKTIGAKDCYGCINIIHDFRNKTSTYNCPNMVNNYVVKHFYRFASEVHNAFSDIVSFISKDRKINVTSIGCGPASELYGLIKCFRDNQISEENVIYKGFDLNPIWNEIQEKNKSIFNDLDIQFFNENFFEYYNLGNQGAIDVLVLNYILSDFSKFNEKEIEQFVNDLIRVIKDKGVSFIIINEVPAYYMTKDHHFYWMEYLCEELCNCQNPLYKRRKMRHADLKNAPQQKYGSSYVKRGDTSIKFTFDIESLTYNPFGYCNSTQVIMKRYDIECK